MHCASSPSLPCLHAGKFGTSAAVGQILPPAQQMLDKQAWSYVSRPNQMVRQAHRSGEEITGLTFSRVSEGERGEEREGLLHIYHQGVILPACSAPSGICVPLILATCMRTTCFAVRRTDTLFSPVAWTPRSRSGTCASKLFDEVSAISLCTLWAFFRPSVASAAPPFPPSPPLPVLWPKHPPPPLVHPAHLCLWPTTACPVSDHTLPLSPSPFSCLKHCPPPILSSPAGSPSPSL